MANHPDPGDPLPSFIYIGADKAGSSWLFDVMQWHPSIYVTPAKDTYFFDRHYERGIDWYRSQFSGAKGQEVIAEICHDYLYSEAAAERMYRDIPEAKLMVTLREPAERARSAYLYLRTFGISRTTFEVALREHEELISHGCYGTALKAYLGRFPRKQIHACLFDDLKSDPQRFAKRLFEFLEVPVRELPEELCRPVRQASAARNSLVAGSLRKSAAFVRSRGFPSVVGRVKSNKYLHRVLFRSLRRDDVEALDPRTEETLRQTFAEEVREAAGLTGLPLEEVWGYVG